MPSFETLLEQMTIDLLKKGSGIPEPLSTVLRETYHRQLLTLTLESIHGPFFTAGPADPTLTDDDRNLKALPALAAERKNEKRFFFSMSEQRWEVLSAFTLSSWTFFTTLMLDISDRASAPLRSGLFKLADCFTVLCRKSLQEYLDDIERGPDGQSSTIDKFGREKDVLRKVIAFSPHIQCAVILDEDGFIIHNEGAAGQVDELGSALARMFYRSNHEISRLECAQCNAITLADHEYTIRIGRLAGTSLALAVSADGPHATAYAYFLHTVAAAALAGHARRTGQLWGVALAYMPESARIRESWFNPPGLVVKGKYVGKKGGKSFHLATCQILTKTDPALLHWFESRTVAIENGLRPCVVCNP